MDQSRRCGWMKGRGGYVLSARLSYRTCGCVGTAAAHIVTQSAANRQG